VDLDRGVQPKRLYDLTEAVAGPFEERLQDYLLMSKLHLTYREVREVIPIWQRNAFLECIAYELSEGQTMPQDLSEASSASLADLGFSVVKREE
jgi:hypothetical protein